MRTEGVRILSSAPFSLRRTQRLPSLSSRRAGFETGAGAGRPSLSPPRCRWAKRLLSPGLRRTAGNERGTGSIGAPVVGATGSMGHDVASNVVDIVSEYEMCLCSGQGKLWKWNKS